jgi:hypothetical protein
VNSVDIAGSESLTEQIDAVVENPQSPHETTDEVVQAALEGLSYPGELGVPGDSSSWFNQHWCCG